MTVIHKGEAITSVNTLNASSVRAMDRAEQRLPARPVNASRDCRVRLSNRWWHLA